MSRSRSYAGSVALSFKPLIQRALLLVFIIASATLVMMERNGNQIVATMRMAMTDALVPVINALSQPVEAFDRLTTNMANYLSVYEQNQQLRAENTRLLQWHQAAQALEAENLSLRGLLNYHPQESTSFISAKVVGNMGSHLSQTAIINVGAAEGVELHQAVINEHGLVGRIIKVGDHTAQVLLLTDMGSRLPVITLPSNSKAILAGDRSAMPHLNFVDARHAPQIGDTVVTAGDGGVFPAGLPVGKVFSISDDDWYIRPFVDFSRMQYVRVVDFAHQATASGPVAR